MLTSYLHQAVLDNTSKLKSSFLNAKPFKHLVIDEFFQKDFCEKLLSEFPDFDEKLATTENKTIGKKAVNQEVKDIGKSFKELDKLVKNKAFLQHISAITGIDDLIYDPYYFGGGTHNSLHGQDLDPHVDFTHHPLTGHHRRMNLIVYLNKEWKKEWGGNIELHKNPRLELENDEIISIEPLFNRAVIFETNNISWHGFPRINLPQDKQHITRKSFALYYYTDKRDQPVKPHSTIYVERHLPSKIKPGTTLSENDYQEIKTLLNRRDQHLKRLYSYITHNAEEIADLKRQLLMKNTKFDDLDLSEISFDESRLLAKIHELKNSTSWKITAPLRKFKRFLRKIKS